MDLILSISIPWNKLLNPLVKKFQSMNTYDTQQEDYNDIIYYINGQIHKDESPARKLVVIKGEDKVISSYWYQLGRLHNDGPAIVDFHNGELIRESWYNHGMFIKSVEYKNKCSIKNLNK